MGGSGIRRSWIGIDPACSLISAAVAAVLVVSVPVDSRSAVRSPSDTAHLPAAQPVTRGPLDVSGSHPTGTYEYTVRHQYLGKIGTHIAKFEQNGRDLVIQVKMRHTVKVPLLTPYRFESDGREVWRDGRLVAYETTTNDNGSRATVSAWAEGEKFVIDGPNGRTETTRGLSTTHLWSPSLLATSTLLEPTSGRLYIVGITPDGDETIDSLDGDVNAHKYVISGEMSSELWYADDGTWLRMQIIKYGSTVTFALVSKTP